MSLTRSICLGCVVLTSTSVGCQSGSSTRSDAGTLNCSGADASKEDYVAASKYDQSCTSASDCVAVGQGSLCDPCAWRALAPPSTARRSGSINRIRGSCHEAGSCFCPGEPNPQCCAEHAARRSRALQTLGGLTRDKSPSAPQRSRLRRSLAACPFYRSRTGGKRLSSKGSSRSEPRAARTAPRFTGGQRWTLPQG